jgi:signal transduction histidine kinase/sugar lactone lactonase YvrE
MRVKTKKRIGRVSDVIAAIGLIAVFVVILTGSSKNLSKIDPANAALASVSTDPAVGLTTNSADLTGTINSSDSFITARGFEWGTDTSYGNQIDQYFSTTPSFVSRWGTVGAGNGEFNSPTYNAIDSSNNVYISDRVNNRIQKFDADGNYITQWGSFGSGNGQFDGNLGIAIDSADNVYVADANNFRVQKFSSTGTYITQWGSSGSGNGQFNSAKGLAIDSTDKIYVTDDLNNRVQVFNTSGVYQFQFGSAGSGNGQFNQPIGIGVDPSDNIFVADTNNNRVEKFNSSGTYQSQFGSAGSGNGQFNFPLAITANSLGYIFVADGANNRVQIFSPDGTYFNQWGSAGSGNGQFNLVAGISINSAGYIYVIDTGNNRVQRFYQANPLGSYIEYLPGLACGTTYHYRAYATNSDGTSYGADESFTTFSCPPDMTIQTDPATLIGEDSTKLNGNITYSGSGIVSRGFEWGTTITYGNTVFDPTPWGFSTGAYALPLSGLACNTTYHYRAIATNGTGAYYGDDQSFTTTACTPDMTVQTDPASGTGDTVSTLNGDILTTKSTITARGFQWGLSSTYTNTINDTPNTKAYTYNSQFGVPGSGNGEFQKPTDAATDSSGNVFIADKDNNRIQKFDSNGNYLAEFGTLGSGDGQFDNPLTLAIDSSDNIFVVDAANYRVQKFDSSFNFLTKWGSFGSGDSQFDYMQGITIDSTGNVYVADGANNNIQKFDNDGNFILKWGSFGTGDGQFSGLTYAALDTASNYLYVVDSGNNRIQKFDLTGNYISQFGSLGSGGGQFNTPVYAQIDSYNNIYVSDAFNYRVQQLDLNGNYIGQFGSFGNGDGQFYFPQGFNIFKTNNSLYFVDTGNNRVEKFTQINAFPAGPFSDSISGLTACTTYHYRAFATNQTTTAYGNDATFTTTGCPTPPPVPPTPPTPPGPNPPGPITPTTPTTPGTTPLSPPTTTGAGIIPGTSTTPSITQPAEPSSPLVKVLRAIPKGLSTSIPYLLILLLLILAILYAIQSYREYRSIQRFNMLLSRYHNLQFGSRNFVALTNHYLGTPLGILQFSSELLVTSRLFSKETAQNVATAIKDIKDKVHELLTESGKATAQSMENINPKLVNNTVNRSSLSPSVWVPMLIAGSLLVITDLLFVYAKVYQLNLASLAVQIALFALCALLIILAFRSYVRNRFIRKQRSELLQAEQRLMDEKMNFVHKTTESLKSDIAKLQEAGKGLPKNDQTKPFMRGLSMLVGVEKSFELMQEFSTISPFESISASETQGVVDEVINRHKQQIEAKNISIHKDLTNDANLGLSKSALIILMGSTINNAIKFSKDGGNVLITAKNSIDGTKITITDNGVGIPKDKLDELMEPFNRATDAMKYDYEGIGLGLYLDRIIMEQIGGNIEIKSSPGNGTTIEMRIPRGRVLENPEPLKHINTEGSNVFTPKTA